MARKNDKSRVQSGTGGANDRQRPGYKSLKWVNPYFDQADLDWLERELPNMAAIILEAYENAPLGYNFSVKYDRQSDRYLASVRCEDTGDANDGYAVSVRGATAPDSMYALAYAIGYKLSWEFGTGESENSGRWG